jgi:ariadne-1
MSISLSPQSNYIHYFVLTIIIFITLLIMHCRCPGCNVPIEKNTGCNHMQCIKCKAGFCWLCLSLLDAHLPHICNRYDSADSADDDFERQALYTVTRYEAHDGAAAFTLNQYINFEPKKFNETYWFLDQDKDPEIMAQALEILLAGRDFLKHSYVKLLYLKDPKSAKLHEDHHGCLEMFTERLSQLTEMNLHSQFMLGGQFEIDLHFRRLAFYTDSVTKYMERITCLE